MSVAGRQRAIDAVNCTLPDMLGLLKIIEEQHVLIQALFEGNRMLTARAQALEHRVASIEVGEPNAAIEEGHRLIGAVVQAHEDRLDRVEHAVLGQLRRTA